MREKIKLESTAGTGHFYTTTKNKKTMPEKMEAIRVEATKQAAKVKDEKNDRIRQVVGFWPETLTTFQLRDFIAQDIDYTGKVTSLIYRMRRNGLLEFRVDGLWHNLCRLPYA